VGNPIEIQQPHEDNAAARPLPNGWKAACGALTRGGATCRRPPVAGRTRCRLHGGATPRGPRSPHFKHGRYSKVFPRDMRAAYQRVRSNPNLLQLKDDIAALEAKQCSLLASMDKLVHSGEGPAADRERLWREFSDLAQEKAVLVKAERDWIAKLRNFYTAEQALAIGLAIKESAERNFGHEPERLGQFLDDVLRMMGEAEC
jgi:hypothetical protein